LTPITDAAATFVLNWLHYATASLWNAMALLVGLDVSLKTTSICVVEQ